MLTWVIVLAVCLGLAVFYAINVTIVAKELKAEIEHYGEYTASFRDTDTAN